MLYLGNNENKNSEKDLNKIEAGFAKRKQKMNSLKTKLQKCYNVKGKLHHIQQVIDGILRNGYSES